MPKPIDRNSLTTATQELDKVTQSNESLESTVVESFEQFGARKIEYEEDDGQVTEVPAQTIRNLFEGSIDSDETFPYVFVEFASSEECLVDYDGAKTTCEVVVFLNYGFPIRLKCMVEQS